MFGTLSYEFCLGGSWILKHVPVFLALVSFARRHRAMQLAGEPEVSGRVASNLHFLVASLVKGDSVLLEHAVKVRSKRQTLCGEIAGRRNIEY